jgi:uncharacterized protein (TIGR02145 family)
MKKITIILLTIAVSFSLHAQKSDFKDPRDGKVYKTVQIGNQLWMAENLNYDAGLGSWIYDNDPSNANTYGRLYSYKISKKVCPTEWHLPNYTEMASLIGYLGGPASAGGKMKETDTIYWKYPNTGATNISGFSALPGGALTENVFANKREVTGFWYNEINDVGSAIIIFVDSAYIEVADPEKSSSLGLSVRCINDKTMEDKTVKEVKASNHDSDSFTDKRDGKVYRTIKIGNQTWMAENLKFNDPESRVYANNPFFAETYGRLYSWETAKKVCPAGWHLPSLLEWSELIVYLGEEKAAGKMKEAGTLHWLTPNKDATNQSGFTALPGGCDYGPNTFSDHEGRIAFFWTSEDLTSHSSSSEAQYSAFSINLKYDNEEIDTFQLKESGLSVRCIKD